MYICPRPTACCNGPIWMKLATRIHSVKVVASTIGQTEVMFLDKKSNLALRVLFSDEIWRGESNKNVSHLY